MFLACPWNENTSSKLLQPMPPIYLHSIFDISRLKFWVRWAGYFFLVFMQAIKAMKLQFKLEKISSSSNLKLLTGGFQKLRADK